MARRYGVWAGNPQGVSEHAARCIVEVLNRDGWVPHQCYRKRGYGLEGLYCFQHTRMAAQGRRLLVPPERGEP